MFLVVVAIGMLVAGCACRADPRHSSVPSEDTLRAMLLVAEDLGEGWTAIGEGTSPVEASAREMLCPLGRSLTLLDVDTVTTASFVYRAAVSSSAEAPIVVEELSAVPAAEAERFMSEARRSIEDCIGEEWQTPEGQDVALESLVLSGVGDSAIGYRMVVDVPSPARRTLVDVALVRVDTVVARLIVTSAEPTVARSFDFGSLIDASVEKISLSAN